MKQSPEKIILYTDGGSRGNPGPAGLGVIVKSSSGETLKKYGETFGVATNNEAEYQAVIFGLKKIKQLFGRDVAKGMAVKIRSDSELLVRQNLGQYKILDDKIKDFFIQIWNLKQDFKSVAFELVPREENKEADWLVNQALDQKPAKGLF